MKNSLYFLTFILISSCNPYKHIQVDECLVDAFEDVCKAIPKRLFPKEGIKRIRHTNLKPVAVGWYLDGTKTVEVDTGLAYTHKRQMIVIAHEIGHAAGLPHLDDHPIMDTHLEIANQKLKNRSETMDAIKKTFKERGKGYNKKLSTF